MLEKDKIEIERKGQNERIIIERREEVERLNESVIDR